MKPIAQRPCAILRPRRPVSIATMRIYAILHAIRYSFNGHPARLLLVPFAVRYQLRAAVQRLYHAIRPRFRAIAEGVAGALWLLLLIFGLNLFAALV